MTAAQIPVVTRATLKSAIVATLIMFGSVAAAWWLTPKRYWFEELGRPDLEQIVPRQFGDWVVSDKTPALMVDPERTEMLRVIYSQTLARIYVNRNSGRTVMLSIALGVDQSHATQLHHPEGCYRTQGFVVDDDRYDTLSSPAGAIKLTRFDSHAHGRKEPVSYWIRVGRSNARSPLEMHLARLALAARGYIADGLLFRVSEISPDARSSFQMQDQFMDDLISAVPAAQRRVLIGSTAT